ncbi:Z-ring formation inhibitor MciZ [Caldibacillus thermoamylovorans]|uniref:Z-ring formation inhibitor MciZ n=1 Tax=Caldibacillus thermoamylovorans TaxID=35841 RepID=UPI0037BE7F25
MKRVVLSGKIWEVRNLLKVYGKRYTYVTEWIDGMESNGERRDLEVTYATIYPFPKKLMMEGERI